MKVNPRPNARMLMTHSSAWHTLFARNDQSSFPDSQYNERHVFKQKEMAKLVGVVNKDPGRIHDVVEVALVGA